MVYPAIGHPAGPITEPWFQIRSGLAFPVGGHPEARGLEPWYRMQADGVYPAVGHRGQLDASMRIFAFGPPPSSRDSEGTVASDELIGPHPGQDLGPWSR
jgi:hypothetical protein